jgi:predicted membrane protein (TIGR00267 family)
MTNGFKSYISKLFQKFKKAKLPINFTAFDEIARRAFVNNAFDGALTLLGILMGNAVLGEISPRTIISTGFGACLAMGMSGAFGRYFSERAERKYALHQMERYMFTDLSGSVLERESKKKVLTISLVDGLSPTLAAMVPLLPFILVQASVIPLSISLIASFVLDFLILFILGAFLGKISEENVFIHGISVVAVGFITAIIILVGSIVFS